MKAGSRCQDFSHGPFIDEHYVLLRHILDTHQPGGTALEFGVGEGNSLTMIAQHMPVIGFDSFKGLPQDWRDGFPAGSFACDPPDIPNTELVIGWFEDTVPLFDWPDHIGLIHFDADLYSSTRTVLNYAPLKPGCFIVFDQWHGYEGCEQYEQRAWREHAESTNISWEVIGHSFQQWAIRVA